MIFPIVKSKNFDHDEDEPSNYGNYYVKVKLFQSE